MGLGLALLMGGCAFSALATIVGRVTAVKSPTQLAPSWPSDDTVLLLDQSIAFGDPKILGSLATGALKGELATSSTGIATISPAPIAIPTISLGTDLSFPSSTSVAIPKVSIGIPGDTASIPSTTVTFAQTSAGSQTYSFPGLPGGTNVTVATAKQIAASSLCNCVNNAIGETISVDATASSTQQFADVEDLQLSSSTAQTLAIPVDNETAANLTVTVTLTDGTGQVLGTNSLPLSGKAGGSNTGNVDISLTGKSILGSANSAMSLAMSVSMTGTIPSTTTWADIDPVNDHITIGPSTLNLVPVSGDIHATAQQGTDASGTGYNAALAPLTQTFPVTSQLPASSGVKGLSSVTVASGSMTVTVDNQLAVDGNLGLSFNGISNVTSAQDVSDPSQLAISAVGGVLTLPVDAGTTSVFLVPLNGATITPDASGNVAAVVTPSTLDTDDDRSHPNPHAIPHNWVHVTTSQSLAGSVVLEPLSFQSVAGSVDTTQTIATQSVPFNLPSQFTQTGISPAEISVAVTVANQSQLSGTFTPSIVGLTSSGTQIPLVFSATASPPFSGAFLGASTAGATQSTTLVIDQNNSNILQLLEAGVSELQVGGSVTVQSSDATITPSDQIGGQVTVAIPLSIIVPPFGPGQTHPAIQIQPPSPLNLSSSTTAQLDQVLQSAELDLRVDNGWQFPLVLNVLLSTTTDPYSDANAIVRTLSLGSGPEADSSLSLTAQQIAELAQLKTIGFEISSPGTGGSAISILPTDTLHVQVSAHISAKVGTPLITSFGKL